MGTAVGIQYNFVSTTQQAPLGFKLKRVDPDNPDRGEQEWIYVKANVALAAGNVCMRASGEPKYEVRKSLVGGCPPGSVCGVAQHTIAQDSYGFILRSGIGNVLPDGAATIVINEGLMPSNGTAGTAEAAGATQTAAVFGWALATASGGAVTQCVISCQG